MTDPTFITILANNDKHARWTASIDCTDVMNAYRTGGIYLLATLNEEGELTVAFKPGRQWDATWSPPIQLNRR
jgi:hypothetical protein